MSRAYEQIPGSEKEEPDYLCPWKIFAGNRDLLITINNSTNNIHFNLREQAAHCGIFCDAKEQCTMEHKKAIIKAFSPQPKEEKIPSIWTGSPKEKGVCEVNGEIIKQKTEKSEKRTEAD